MRPENRLIFLDLETTGLEEDVDSILEIGIVVTEEDFGVIDSFQRVIHYELYDDDFEINPNIKQVVIDMHTDNGLWDECLASETTVEYAEEDALQFLSNLDFKEGTQPMVGNSIGFDRSFLKGWMPDLERFFHYRNLDVSSLTIFNERYLPDVYAGRPQGKPHRSIGDCMNSIEILKYYQKRLRYV